MLKITGSEDFYPTPEDLLCKIATGMDWQLIESVLEPSAGRGNIADFVKMKRETAFPRRGWCEVNADIDCIEIEPELRAILKEKGYRVVHDNFLTFHTYKHYDLVLMNPPFSNGAKHLLKAIEVQQTSGGGIICILNAETLRNPYSNERKDLLNKIEQYKAEVEYYANAFSQAENPTDVEIACVKLIVPAPKRSSVIFETLREKGYEDFEKNYENSELAEADIVSAFVAQFNREVEWGLRLYDELKELQSKALEGSQLSLSMCTHDYDKGQKFSVNSYVRSVRKKYWDRIFRHPRIIGKLTSNLQTQYLSQVDEFAHYDFSYWNIKTVQEEIARNLVKGVEDCIIALFDELSQKHSWDRDLPNNIHYYNGWKTNLSWKINKKVIIPLQVWENFKGHWWVSSTYKVRSKLSDIEKALDYLDNGETQDVDLDILDDALRKEITADIQLKYFRVTFYKKGTCHLTFTNERLLKKLNIYGSQRKGWLPKGYARRKYEEMDAEEQAVINSFEGRESYNASLMEAEYYLFDAGGSLPMLGA